MKFKDIGRVIMVIAYSPSFGRHESRRVLSTIAIGGEDKMSLRTRFALPCADDLSPLRAMHSLREQHVTALAAVLSETSSPYGMERHEGCEGDLTILLESSDESRANLVITRAVDGFHLAANRGDDYQPLSNFGTLAQLVTAVREIISSSYLAAETVVANR